MTARNVVFLGEETEIVPQRQHALEQGASLGVAALHTPAIDKPVVAG
jgi:hypothetical protein